MPVVEFFWSEVMLYPDGDGIARQGCGSWNFELFPVALAFLIVLNRAFFQAEFFCRLLLG